jgi:hypothetical protein
MTGMGGQYCNRIFLIFSFRIITECTEKIMTIVIVTVAKTKITEKVHKLSNNGPFLTHVSYISYLYMYIVYDVFFKQ